MIRNVTLAEFYDRIVCHVSSADMGLIRFHILFNREVSNMYLGLATGLYNWLLWISLVPPGK